MTESTDNINTAETSEKNKIRRKIAKPRIASSIPIKEPKGKLTVQLNKQTIKDIKMLSVKSEEKLCDLAQEAIDDLILKYSKS